MPTVSCCKNCKRDFPVNPRTRNHQYCNRAECQRARKREWQKQKMANDKDYRANQSDAVKRWREKHPQYWKNYRKAHPEYTEKNREKQRERNKKPASILQKIAKMDSIEVKNHGFSGRYRIIPLADDGIAKMDSIVVQIEPVSRYCV
jgi:hypothetical protein